MARHMGKHIPGNPALIVENMTGAGTLIAAKYLHSSAKPDGLSFGIFNGALILGGVLGKKSIDFDMRELEYLGVPVQDSTVCALRKESGVTQDGSMVRVEVTDQARRLEPGQQHQRRGADHRRGSQLADPTRRRLQRHQRDSHGRGRRRAARRLLGLGNA